MPPKASLRVIPFHTPISFVTADFVKIGVEVTQYMPSLWAKLYRARRQLSFLPLYMRAFSLCI